MKRGATILIVDDEPLVREAMHKLLEYGGCEVVSVSNGEDVLNLLGQRKFDLLITDFSMPGMAGDQLVARVRQLVPEQRIIMVTAFVEEFRVFGQPEGTVDALLLKPFSFKELSEAVELVLSQEHHLPPSVMPPIIQRPHSQDFLPPSET